MSTFSHEAACREAWVTEGLSDKTIHAYVAVLARCEAWAAARGRSLEELSAIEIRDLAADWPLTRASRMQLRVALGRFWGVLERPAPPTGAVRVPSKPRYACRALSEPQAASMARAARQEASAAALAVSLALYAGLRRTEIAGFAWDQVDLEAGWIRVVGKCDVTGDLPVHGELAAKLADWPRSGRYVFPGERGREHVTPATVWLWVRRFSLKVLGEEIAPHRLRHTAIATLHDQTTDLRTAQAFGRHAQPETTAIYTRVPRRRLVAAVEALDYERAAQSV